MLERTETAIGASQCSTLVSATDLPSDSAVWDSGKRYLKSPIRVFFVLQASKSIDSIFHLDLSLRCNWDGVRWPEKSTQESVH